MNWGARKKGVSPGGRYSTAVTHASAHRFVWPATARLGGALRRLVTPASYLAVFGAFQVAYLWGLRVRFGRWIPLLGVVGLLALLWLLLQRDKGWRWKTAALGLLIALTTAGPAVASMVTRSQVGLTIEQDGLVQIELAVDRVLGGQPIYGIDWSTTELKRFSWAPSAPNPALKHFVYTPLTVLVGIPVRLVSRGLGLPFDYRTVLLGFLALALAAILALRVAAPGRFMVAAALFLNPLVSLFFFVGHNDVEYLAMLLLGLALLARARPLLASASFGIAVAFKPFAAFALPFLGLVLWRHWHGRPDLHLKEVALAGTAVVAPSLLTVLPFWLSDPEAFWRDTVLFTSGGVSDAYPIGGYGFGALLLAFRLVGHPTDAFPFLIFQLAAAVPVLALAARAFLRRPTLGRWMAGYVSLFAAFALFGRFFNDSYAALILALTACVPALGDAALVASAAPRPGRLPAGAKGCPPERAGSGSQEGP